MNSTKAPARMETLLMGTPAIAMCRTTTRRENARSGGTTGKATLVNGTVTAILTVTIGTAGANGLSLTSEFTGLRGFLRRSGGMMG